MNEWNYDLSAAPGGTFREVSSGKEATRKVFEPENVQTASKCGKVIVTHKLQSGRWNCYGENEAPIAWAPLLKHPEAQE